MSEQPDLKLAGWRLVVWALTIPLASVAAFLATVGIAVIPMLAIAIASFGCFGIFEIARSIRRAREKS